MQYNNLTGTDMFMQNAAEGITACTNLEYACWYRMVLFEGILDAWMVEVGLSRGFCRWLKGSFLGFMKREDGLARKE